MSTGSQPISLVPTAQWVTSGETPGYGRQPRPKIRQGAMPQGRSRSPSSKRPDTYSTPSWRAAGEYTRQRAFHVFDMEAATLHVGAYQERKKQSMSVSEGCSPKSLLTFSQEEEHVFDSSQIDFGNAIFPRIRLLLSDSKLQSVVSASAHLISSIRKSGQFSTYI